MKHLYWLIGLFWMLFVLEPNPLHAQNPTVYYQTVFKRQDGRIFGDGTYNVTFKLYESEASSEPFWSEAAMVIVKDGIFIHYLGSVVPLVSKDFTSSAYITITFGTFESSPRKELSYAPYSFSASIANEVACSGALGDVKHSILNPEQFAQVNGACWVPMDARPLQTSDKLRQIVGISSLPQVGGLFIRTNDYNMSDRRDPGRNTTSVNLQADLMASHNHGMDNQGWHRHGLRSNTGASDGTSRGLRASSCNAVSGNNNGNNSGYPYNFKGNGDPFYMTEEGGHTHNIFSSGGAETRPKNINLWTYIRIN